MQVEVSGTAARQLKELVERGGFYDERVAAAAAIETLRRETEASSVDLEPLVRKALDDVDAGRVAPLTRELAAEISRMGRANRAARERTPH